MTLTDFLLARIAEDEAAAMRAVRAVMAWEVAGREVYEADVRRPDRCDEHPADLPNDCDDETIATASAVGDNTELERARAVHMARHDPRRVMAECEAKRQIIGMASPSGWSDDGEPIGSSYVGAWWDALHFLALPYADHPDYDQEWALG